MNYRKEAREATQKLYGGYCEMCRRLEIEILPYYKFTLEEYNRVKSLNKIKP